MTRLLLSLLLLIASCAAAQTAPATAPVYEQRAASADGTGRFYMGREIAAVMGHEGADWLERPQREREEGTDLLLEQLELKPDDVVADIGAGSGYFTFRIAPLVPDGKVVAVDIQPEMLELIRAGAAERALANVEPVLGTVEDPQLPESSVDVVLLVDAYHEFSHPREMMQAIVRALKPGGRVIQVEFRAEDPHVPIKPLHKMTEAQALLEMQAAGLVHRETRDVLPRQHLLIFEKPIKSKGEDGS